MRPEAVTDYMRSRPVRLEWAGWSTDTYQLQRAGWAISAHQDMCSRTMVIAVEHQQYACRGMTRIVENWLYEHGARYSSAGEQDSALANVRLPIGLYLGNRVDVHLSNPPAFQPVDAYPSFRSEIRSLEDLAHFAPMKSLEAPYVLPEADVDQLLAIILEKQQKAKTDYFRDMVRKEGHILPAHTMSAQIITLREAA